MKRILIAGLVGGLVMFAWGAFSHMALPLGEMGIRSLPGEDTVIPAMKAAIHEPGFYLFPGMDMSTTPTPEQERAWEAKVLAGPTGVLVYNPGGQQHLSLKNLLTELGSNIVAALLAAFLLSLIGGPTGKRALSMAVIGLVGWLSISISQWNWYQFPGALTAAEGIDQVVSWFLTGLAMAAIVKSPES
jgi:hypothetical protein